MLTQMRKDVEAGKAFLQEAIARYPKSFSPLYVNMVKASELSGGFSRMLSIAWRDICRSRSETRNMIVGALTYPAIIALIAASARRSSC